MRSKTSRREFLQLAGAAPLAAALGAGAAPAAAPGAARPNIVFILIDDLRYDALRCLGHPWLDTPHLDALAAGGMIFDRAYVTTALCSPSRASILTSTYAHRHGVLDNNTPLPQDLTLYPALLREAAYRTAFIGKWHMGGGSGGAYPGFDRWVSFPGQGNYEAQTLNVDGASVPTTGYLTDVLADYAVQFIQEPKAGPFCLFLAHKATHADFIPAPRHKGCYADKTYPHPASMANTDENYRGKPAWVRAQRDSWHGVDGMYNKTKDFDQFTRDYAETVRAVDDSVGRVVEALRAAGQLENTLLVFTSDNGFQFGEHGLIDKRTFYEASIRVPMIVHWPGKVAPGSRCRHATINLDHAPTFLEAAGITVPGAFQGRSYLPLLRGESPEWREAFLYEYFWERNFPQTPTVLGLHTGRHKLFQYHGIWDRYELYDLDTDPDEMNNLLADYMVTTESGELDGHIARAATGDTGELFKQLRKALREQLQATGCRPEPLW
jgi:N-acetylglucosamine-6-sulfatase